MDARHTLKCDIYEFDRLRIRCYRYTTFRQWCFSISIGNSTGKATEEYWCEPECTWQTNSINKTDTSDRLDSWASRHWRGIELVFKSLDCFTVRPFFSTGLITRMFYLFINFYFMFLIFTHLFIYLGGGGGGGGGAFTFWCCIPISRPPRVFRRFKRRSCFTMHSPHCTTLQNGLEATITFTV